MDSKRILSLLGLALRGGNLAVGEEPVGTAAESRGARLILLASDAAEGTRRRGEWLARKGNCLLAVLPCTKAELGGAFGRSSAAIAALTDTGLAAAVGRKLSELDPARYGALAERLDLKARRAAERKAQQRLRDKEARRTGGKKSAPPAGKPPEREEKPASLSRKPPGSGGRKRRPASGPAERRTDGRRAASRPAGRGPKPRANPYAHSRPVKKGKGSFRKRED